MSPPGLFDLADLASWVAQGPATIAAVALTIAAFLVGAGLQRAARGSPLANPVLVAVVLIALALRVLSVPYETYFAGARPIHLLLGPATVALALPLHRELSRVRRAARAILLSIAAGSIVAAGSAVGGAALLGGSSPTLRALASKSVTTPIAMAIAERTAASPALAAVFVLLTGVVGASVGPWLLDRIGVRDARARGLALGTAAHGIGTARAFQIDAATGAFATLSMGLNGAATAILLPIVWGLVGR